MSNTVLQIKRSATTATPTSLANGELAYSGNSTSNSLFIGMPGDSNTVTRIAGGKYQWLHQSNTSAPGTLTANAVVIADGNSSINEIRTANLVIGATGNTQRYITSIILDSTLSGATNNQIAPAWVIKDYVDNYAASTLDELTDVTLTSATNNQILVYDQAANTWENHSIGGTLDGINVSFNNHDVVIGLSNTLNVNTSIIVANGVTINSTAVLVGNSTVFSNITNQSVTTNTIYVDVISASGNATITGILDVKGNTYIGNNATADIVVFDSRVGSDFTPQANTTYNLGSTNLYWNHIYTGHITGSNGATFNGDVNVTGNLNVTGALTSLNVSTISVTDSLLQLASNNESSDILDIGLYGSYSDGVGLHEHTGLFRDATDGKWKLFKGLTPNPTTTVDTSNATFSIATLVSYLESGAFTSNSTTVSIVANSTISVDITANTLLLDTALYSNSGGTGYKTYSLGDILVGNSTSGIQTLAVGAVGKVLQSNGTTLVYDDLDGGGF